MRPPISGSSELFTFLQGCLQACSLFPVIFFIADARCPFGWDPCQHQKARQCFCACLRAVAQTAPEQRKEIGSPSNSDSFPEAVSALRLCFLMVHLSALRNPTNLRLSLLRTPREVVPVPLWGAAGGVVTSPAVCVTALCSLQELPLLCSALPPSCARAWLGKGCVYLSLNLHCW